MTTSPYDTLIEICDGAIADTYRWERRCKRWNVVNWAMLMLVGALLVTFLVTGVSLWLVLILMGTEGINVFTFVGGRKHLRWIHEIQAKWMADKERYVLDRTQYMEQGYSY